MPVELFVNGTLMRGLELHANLAGAEFLGEFRTAPHYRLFSIGDRHPGMFRVGSGGISVAGELYRLPDEVWERVEAGDLDRQEAVSTGVLMLFAGRNPPKPREILVVTPSLDDAAPLVDAVFGTAPEGRRTPYAITGQAQRQVNPVARAFDSLLALTESRHPASEVFDLLMQEPVCARFDLDIPALDSIRSWIEQAGIRWGLEAEEKTDFKVPATADHTFADGLQRLYLGYALGETDSCVDGRIGSGNPEGQRAEALGKFWRFTEELRQLRREWHQPKNATGWRDSLGTALARFVDLLIDVPAQACLGLVDVVRRRGHRDRSRCPRGAAGGRAGRAHPKRVRPPARARLTPRSRLLAVRARHEGAGLRLRGVRADDRRPREEPPEEAR